MLDLSIAQKALENLGKALQDLDAAQMKPRITVEGMIADVFELSADGIRLKLTNSTAVDLENTSVILARKTVQREFVVISYPPKVRITIERID